jgi:hypothetical protein
VVGRAPVGSVVLNHPHCHQNWHFLQFARYPLLDADQVVIRSFDITSLPNGSYWIEVLANPRGVLFDADASNNVELREVILGGVPGARTVSVPPWHGIDTEVWFGFGP